MEDVILYTVYVHRNKINNKRYVGITMLKPSIRWGKGGSNYKYCPYFWAAIQKYGWDNFEHIILFTGLTKEEAAQKEISLIEEYKTRNSEYGYNLAKGGYSQPGEDNPFFGHHHNEATKQAVAESNRRRVWTPEARKHMSDALKGENSPCAKPVLCVETGVIYGTMKQAAEAMNVTAGKICDVLKGRHKTCCGYHWQYAFS